MKMPDSPFDIEVEWTEQKYITHFPGEFPLEQKKIGVLHFTEETLQNPFYLFQKIEKVVEIAIRGNRIKPGIVDNIRIDNFKICMP